MSRKVLFVATVLRMHVLVFHLPYMRWFQEQATRCICAAPTIRPIPIPRCRIATAGWNCPFPARRFPPTTARSFAA